MPQVQPYARLHRRSEARVTVVKEPRVGDADQGSKITMQAGGISVEPLAGERQSVVIVDGGLQSDCRPMRFNREEEIQGGRVKHTALVTARWRLLFPAANIWRHAVRVGVTYSDQSAQQGLSGR